jgi:L-rhamnose mutarotase
MDSTEVNSRWQAEMAEFFEGLAGRTPDHGFLVLAEIFHLSEERALPPGQPATAATPTPEET